MIQEASASAASVVLLQGDSSTTREPGTGGTHLTSASSNFTTEYIITSHTYIHVYR